MRNNTLGACRLLGCRHYTTYALRRALFGAAGSAQATALVHGSGMGDIWSDNAGAEGPRPPLLHDNQNGRNTAGTHSPGGVSHMAAGEVYDRT